MTPASSAASPVISVVICTRNRADLFDKAIASVVAQDFPRSDYEIVVVDNGSSDHTAEVAGRYAAQANIRYVLEDQIGLCVARNTGWRTARAPYVALFDDDAIALPGWLAAIADAFARSPREVGVIGGKVNPVWLAPRPKWLADEIAGALTIVDWGPEEKPLPDLGKEWLVGANMAAPRSLIAEAGGFHPWLDRVGDKMLSSGDVFLQKEIVRRGYQCLYVPSMAIDHLAPASRLSQAWFTRRFYWQGVSDAVMQIIEDSPSRKRRMKLAAGRFARVAGSPRRIAALSIPTSDAAAFRKKCLALIDVGFAAGILGGAGH